MDISNNQLKNIDFITNLQQLETLNISNNQISDWQQIVKLNIIFYHNHNHIFYYYNNYKRLFIKLKSRLSACEQLVEINMIGNLFSSNQNISQICELLTNIKILNDVRIFFLIKNLNYCLFHLFIC